MRRLVEYLMATANMLTLSLWQKNQMKVQAKLLIIKLIEIAKGSSLI
jgi:hypothetical protein